MGSVAKRASERSKHVVKSVKPGAWDEQQDHSSSVHLLFCQHLYANATSEASKLFASCSNFLGIRLWAVGLKTYICTKRKTPQANDLSRGTWNTKKGAKQFSAGCTVAWMGLWYSVIMFNSCCGISQKPSEPPDTACYSALIYPYLSCIQENMWKYVKSCHVRRKWRSPKAKLREESTIANENQ